MEGKNVPILSLNHFKVLQFQEWEHGAVYPHNIIFVLKLIQTNGTVIKLTSEHPNCSNVTAAGGNCHVTLPRSIYNISVTLTNALGSTTDSKMIDSKIVYCIQN